MDTEGLSEYRQFLASKGIRDLGAGGNASSSASSSVSAAASQIFTMIDKDNSGEISVEEAESIALRLNSQLRRSYGEVEVKAFFSAVSGGRSRITKSQFLNAFEKLAD